MKKCWYIYLTIFLLIANGPLYSTTLTVTNNNATGPGSLAQAVIDANNGDNIVFSGGVTGNIFLSETINIAKSITITGPGSDVLSVDGSDIYQLFNILSGTSTINDLTIANGYSSSNGGGIIVSANLTLNNVSITDCNAENGAAIYQTSGILTVQNCTFQQNTATNYGGACCLNSTFNCNNNIIEYNSAGEGGAIYQIAGSSIFSDNNIFANSAVWGAGIYFKAGTMQSTKDTLCSNSSYSDGSAGGCIYQRDGILTMTNTMIQCGTTVSFAAGIYVENSTATLILDSCQISGNQVTDGRGAGLYINDGNVNIINHSLISDNHALSTTDWGDGGAIYLFKGTLTLTNDTITANSADRNAGAIFVHDSLATLISNGNIITNNEAIEGVGGGIYIFQGNAEFTNTTISQNTNSNKGAGICIWRPSSIINFNACTISNNLTSNGITNNINYGGGIFIDSAMVSISNSTFSQNVGNNTNDSWGPKGGAIYIFKGSLICKNNSFNYDSVYTPQGKGGAIFNDMATISDSNCTFTHNYAGRNGGAIFINNVLASTTNKGGSTFTYNSSGRLGGAIYMENGTLNNDSCSFSYNTTNLAGGAINHNNGTSFNSKCTIINNTSANACGGFYIKSGTATISGTTITDNISSPVNGSDITAILNSVINISNTTTENIYSDTNNFVVGSSDFIVTGNISGNGLITPISTGFLSLQPVINIPLTYPITSGTSDLSLTLTCLNAPTNPVKVKINHGKSGESEIMSDFIDITGETNLNATMNFKISKSALDGGVMENSGLIRFWNGSRYVPVSQDRTTIVEHDTYYEVTITEINQF